tara:strand:+ start:90 stop:488 length:399 start_codon:yes stop_codon:yes gene_type:complete
MTTKIVQAFEAIIEKQFDHLSDEDKADLLDGWIDLVLEKEIYKAIKKPARKKVEEKVEKKPRGATAYQLFQTLKKGSGSQRDIANMWADAKENEPELVAFLKIQATKKNNGEEWTLDMPEDDVEDDSGSDSE